MTLTDSYVAFAKDVQTRLEAAKVTLGIEQIFYGDQERIPVTPAVCIEPGDKKRTLNGLPRRTEVQMTVYLLVYHYQLDSPQTIRENNDELAESIETFLHQDAQFRDGSSVPTVVDSMVTSIESGYQPKRNSLFRASRITLEARSQMQLPANS